MSIWQAVILGLVQGATEFLPVSSSGHLVLAERLMGISTDGVTFEVAVHAGTLVAVLLYFRRRIGDLVRAVLGGGSTGSLEGVAASRRMIMFLVIGSIPAGLVGLIFKSEIEAMFAAPRMAALFLIVTGLWLLAMKWARAPGGTMSTAKAWWIGCAQAVAILPGISRSGATIATGTLLGVSPAVAAEFSFLLSVPAVAGAMVLSLPDVLAAGRFDPAILIGAVTAGITGYFALSAVFAALRRRRFLWFGAYCLTVGVAGVFLLR